MASPGEQSAVQADDADVRRFSGVHASTSAAGAIVPVNGVATASGPTGPQPGAAAAAAAAGGVKRFVRQQVPDHVLHDAALNAAIEALPANYNFEVHKTVWRLQQARARAPALQLPEGLLMYAAVLADIMERFAGADHVIIMGDVTYGACCIDDLSAAAMGADFLVHYGHSCLVPLDVTTVPCLYVFVDIAIDVDHLVGSVQLTFPPHTNLVVAGTIQFSSAIQAARDILAPTYPSLSIPKCRPLSPGEVLGCTAPVLTQAADAIVFLADGRFHLEAIMIANPTVPAYRYDPYSRLLTREQYDHAGMRAARRRAVDAARGARRWGVVLGTLGRQGNPALADTLMGHLTAAGAEVTLFLVSELSPARLALVPGIDAWVQVACPRLSIDWGEAFTRPTLTPYEALVCLGVVPPWWERPGAAAGEEEDSQCGRAGCGTAAGTCGDTGQQDEVEAGAKAWDPDTAPYPMDYYAKEGGAWNSSYHKGGAPRRAGSTQAAAATAPITA